MQTERDITVNWRPISLLFKNDPSPDSPWYAASLMTHRLLRVLESVRATDGNSGFEKLYWEFGSRIHHDGDRDVDAAEALRTVGLDESHAKAIDDEAWDAVIRAGMDAGLALAGHDVGTPIIATANAKGTQVGYFGPVITGIPPRDEGLAMWDALMAMMNVEFFFELKRTRTDDPDPGPRPLPR